MIEHAHAQRRVSQGLAADVDDTGLLTAGKQGEDGGSVPPLGPDTNLESLAVHWANDPRWKVSFAMHSSRFTYNSLPPVLAALCLNHVRGCAAMQENIHWNM